MFAILADSIWPKPAVARNKDSLSQACAFGLTGADVVSNKESLTTKDNKIQNNSETTIGISPQETFLNLLCLPVSIQILIFHSRFLPFPVSQPLLLGSCCVNFSHFFTNGFFTVAAGPQKTSEN